MSLTREQMQMVRRARVEAMLLGIALARNGDRQKVLELCGEEDLQSDIVAGCLSGLREKSNATIKRQLAKWGIEFDGSLSERLCEMVAEFGSQERAREVLTLALHSGRSDLKQVLTEALSELGESDER